MIAILLFLAFLSLLFLWNRKPSSMPPGTYGFPVIGDLPSGRIPITEHMRKRQRKYGNIFTTKWGSLPTVVLTDFHLIKKAFQHPDIQGRSEKSVVKVFHYFENRGVIATDGSLWAENRRFLLHHLGKLGMGKTALEASIQDEAAMLVDYLERSCVGKPSELDAAINLSVGNVVWQMLASRRYNIEDEEGLRFFETLMNVVDFMQGYILVLEIFPILWKILPSFVLSAMLKAGYKKVDAIHKTSELLVRQHLESFDPDNPRDIIDLFALEHPDRDEAGFLLEDDVKELTSIMADVLIAGSETTATSIRWIILYMMLYPEIQAKIHKCLDEAVPRHRLPTLADRDQLHYLDAVILDSMRLSSVVPTAVPHKATADVLFEGYTIPKGTLVMGCTEVCHRDGSAWKHPDQLCPQHFLDDKGRLSAKQEHFLPFSIGRRQCLGESLARMELYLFTAALLQRFTIHAPEGEVLHTRTDPSQFVENLPMKFKVLLRKRI